VSRGQQIERARAGEYRVRLSRAERELLRELPARLRILLAADSEDPALRRLFPPGYEDDPESESEYRRLMGDELLDGRLEALRVLEETADRDFLDDEEIHAWLVALNALRLVLGTRLDVPEDLSERDFDPADPHAHELAVYAYLSWLQEQAVAAVAADV
jgi:Domain of unknown function (DUF2017)